MNRFPRRSASALIFAFAVCADGAVVAPAAVAAAQTTETGAAAGSPRVEQHIGKLHEQLGITPAEQPRWDQFTAVMRENAAHMEKASAERGSKLATMNAVDDMNSYAQLAQTHAADVQKLATAFQALYADFSDQQKAVADAVFRKDVAAHGRKR